MVDTTNRKERYLFPGNDVKVVPSGEYKDCLLVLQHRYFLGGGSYDWFWLLRPDGKELGPVGEDDRELRGDLREDRWMSARTLDDCPSSIARGALDPPA